MHTHQQEHTCAHTRMQDLCYKMDRCNKAQAGLAVVWLLSYRFLDSEMNWRRRACCCSLLRRNQVSAFQSCQLASSIFSGCLGPPPFPPSPYTYLIPTPTSAFGSSVCSRFSLNLSKLLGAHTGLPRALCTPPVLHPSRSFSEVCTERKLTW